MKRQLIALSFALTALFGAAACGDKEGDDARLEDLFNEDGSFGGYDGSGGEAGDNYWANNPTNSYGNEENGYGYTCVDGACVDYGY